MEDPTSERDFYDPQFFAKIAAVENEHFWFAARNRTIKAAIETVVRDLPPGYRLLEVGCGTGVVLRQLVEVCHGGEVMGMDLFPEAVAFATERAGCPVIVGDILNPPELGQFDIVAIFDVLEHLPNDDQIVVGLSRILKPGGKLIVTVPAHMSLWSYFDIAARHKRRYSAEALSRLLCENGFEIEYQTQFMALLFPLIMALRKFYVGQSEVDPDIAAEKAERELKIVPIINPVLRSVLSVEAWIVKRRWRLPIGTSHLAVARKMRPAHRTAKD